MLLILIFFFWFFEKCAVCKHFLIPSDVKVIVKAKLVGSAIVVLLLRNGGPDGGLGGWLGRVPTRGVRNCVGEKNT